MSFEDQVARVLTKLHCPDAPLVGRGGEGCVFAFHADEVIKVYEDAHPAYLEELAQFQGMLSQQHLPFATPLILEIGQVAGTYYTRERRLNGQPFSEIVSHLAEDQQQMALANYLAALHALHAIELNERPYGQAIAFEGAMTAPSWTDFLLQICSRVIEQSRTDLALDVADINSKLAVLPALLNQLAAMPSKRLVHGDYFLGNVLFDTQCGVSAVLDFSPHTVVGDSHLDIAGAVAFLDIDPCVTPQHVQYVRSLIENSFPAAIDQQIAVYTLYYSAYLSDTKRSDPKCYAWCVRHLNDAACWERALR